MRRLGLIGLLAVLPGAAAAGSDPIFLVPPPDLTPAAAPSNAPVALDLLRRCQEPVFIDCFRLWTPPPTSEPPPAAVTSTEVNPPKPAAEAGEPADSGRGQAAPSTAVAPPPAPVPEPKARDEIFEELQRRIAAAKLNDRVRLEKLGEEAELVGLTSSRRKPAGPMVNP